MKMKWALAILMCQVATQNLLASKESAEAFIARVNAEIKEHTPEESAAAWLAATYIIDDSQLLSSIANERALTRLGLYFEEASAFVGVQTSAAVKRALTRLRLGVTVPPLKNATHLAELTKLATKLEGDYGAGKYCSDPQNPASCMSIGDIEDVLSDTAGKSYEELLKVWEGWHTISIPMRADYRRFTDLINEGAHDQGFLDAGAIWRSGYDMDPQAFAAETERLFAVVSPLYDKLHCYVKNKLVAHWGEKGEVNGMLPAHLTGNLWQQEWGNLWPIVEPYKGVKPLDVSTQLQKQRDDHFASQVKKLTAQNHRAPTPEEKIEIGRDADLLQAKDMMRLAEKFYISLGFPPLPTSFWEKTQFVKPRDREVVCHASAWPINMKEDVRIKMCMKPDEESLRTIFHEMGHIYYFLAYNKQPSLFQNGANDGFHEAIGDSIVMAMTPDYLFSQGLLATKPVDSEEATINAQMHQALERIAFLPFGFLIDRWRWGVFDGSITADNYNHAWWDLKAKYQGVAPATARGEEFFDAGAKYHVPGNTPYIRYFLAHIYMFQFYKALCDASGYKGPLHRCSYFGSKEAGARFWNMLSKGSSQPWQQTLKELTGSEQIDAGAVLEYFEPLSKWLDEQNKNAQCQWKSE